MYLVAKTEQQGLNAISIFRLCPYSHTLGFFQYRRLSDTLKQSYIYNPVRNYLLPIWCAFFPQFTDRLLSQLTSCLISNVSQRLMSDI
ncbi:hypothetical protein SAMN05216326_10212 [Nitrosomonas marina]|uniref:Uncharacterized protein n=1 Tax=Nitrosomonas marina TaxID=917 RepID=A0A1H9YIA6_9PROT|nr:hypothetical protein SAMN05216326_10212 [Nitrosomonas marina]